MKKGKCFVISAPSGAGKTTLANMLLEDSGRVFYNSISDTTRAPRNGEVDGRDYNFVSVPEFEAREKDGHYLEWAKVHGNYYGTPKAPLLEAMDKGEYPLLVIDVQGYFQMKEKISSDRLCSIFILPSAGDGLVKMIDDRGDMDKETLKLRMENAKKEMSVVGEFKYHLRNDYGKLDLAYGVLRGIVEAEMGK